MQSPMQSRADLHVHSKYSDRPSEWFLRRIGAPECFTEPIDLYHKARRLGMDFVTISDHNCIRGALEIAHLPGTFISSEVTTYFPENGCKIHCLVSGVSEAQFSEIQRLRENIYDLQRYLAEQQIVHTITHPLYAVNDRMTIDHVERLLLLFERFESINGTRDARASEMVEKVFGNLTPELIEEMADRQGIVPHGPEPWKKCFVGGSDDHSGVHCASAHTVAPYAEDVDEFLAHLRRGDHRPAGQPGGSVLLGHCVYHIAYDYYKHRFITRNNGKPNLIGELFEVLLREPEQPKVVTFGQRVRSMVTPFVKPRQIRKLSDAEQALVEEFSTLFSQPEHRDVASDPTADRRTFHIASRVSHALGFSLVRKFGRYLSEGRLIDSLQTVASLGPIALGIAPYLAAFSTQHKDERLLRQVAERFPVAKALREKSDRKVWVTDTLGEVNGVARTIRTLAGKAAEHGKKLTVLSCAETPPPSGIDVKNFRPVGTFPLPEYESQQLSFPPVLEIIEYIERNKFNEVVISTPGPLGLTALAAAHLLRLRTTGIYHTDFPMFVRYMTQDDALEELTWRYMLWFYEQMQTILVPSEYYRNQLIQRGFDPTKLEVMVRGVDIEHFNPSRRDPAFWSRYGLGDALKFIYVGRVSKEKNLHEMVEAFKQIESQGCRAELVIVGDGPYKDELQRRNGSANIAFTGVLKGEALATAYASADVFIFPSTSDTFGNAVLEAQACGLPAIVTNRGGPADIVRPHDSGLVVDLGEPGALAGAMKHMAENTDLRREMRRRAITNATQRTWDQVFLDFWNRTPPGERRVDSAQRPLLHTNHLPGQLAVEA